MNTDDSIMLLAAAPATAYREYLYRPHSQLARWIDERFDVVAGPGQRVGRALQNGDLLIEIQPGRMGSGRCVTIDGPELDAIGSRSRLTQGQLILRPLKSVEMSEPLPVEPTSEAEDTDLGRLADQAPPDNQIADAALIAGIAVADAIQIGLGAVAIGQSQLNAFSGGSLQVTYDSQQRMLTPQARLEMPGSMRPKNTYTRTLFWLPSLRPNLAQALITITWDGNDYGEIGTPTISKDLDQTSDWSRSSASINMRAVSRIPVGTDPRIWPLWYHYEGNFDPWGNGEWDFNGDFEINAFGAIAFHNHKWKSRSRIEFLNINVDPDTWKGPDVAAAVPTIPADQMAYLRAHAPT